MSRRAALQQNRRRTNKPVAGTTWTPASLGSSLVQWIIGDNATASLASDQSTGGHDMVEVTGANQPTIVAASLNGHSVIRFGGGTQHMQSGAWQVGTTAMTTFMVLRVTSLGTTIAYSKALNTTDWEWAGQGSGIIAWDIAGANKALSNAAVDGGTAHVLIGTYDSTLSPSPTTKMYVDGTLQTTQGTSSAAITNGSDLVGLGAYVGGTDNSLANMTGDIAEAGACNRALTTGEIAQLQAYLKAKYGTP